LHTSDFGANTWSEFDNVGSFVEKFLEVGVCKLSMFYVMKSLKRRIFLGMVPGWEVLWVL
jgi:hypothetical protein